MLRCTFFSCWFLLGGYGLLAGGINTAQAASGSSLPTKIINKRVFTLTIVPRDAASADANKAQLYSTRNPKGIWRSLGACKVWSSPSGVVFKKKVTVAGDGVYYFISRAGDAAGMKDPPARGARPEQRVIVDTTKPVLELTRPVGNEIIKAGQLVSIAWKAQDANFDQMPVRLAISEDRGRTWLMIANALPAVGTFAWTVPSEQKGTLIIRVEAVDKANLAAWATTNGLLRVLPVESVNLKNPAAEVAKKSPHVTEKVRFHPRKRKLPPLPTATAMTVAVSNPPVLPIAAQSRTTKEPLDASKTAAPTHKRISPEQNYGAWQAYLMAGNLARQGRLKDSLQYYRAAVDAAPDFALAWYDTAAVYRELDTTALAEQAILHAIAIEPKNPLYRHERGEIFQTHGIDLLKHATNKQGLEKGGEAIQEAILAYGKALKLSQKSGHLAERAATYFRLGEICYFVNRDVVGARSYWRKVLSLHSPTPNLDDVMHAEGTAEEKKSLRVYQRYTGMKIKLFTWQTWSRSYLEQLATFEKQGALPAAGTQQTPPRKGAGAPSTEATPIPKVPAVERPPKEYRPRSQAAYLQPGYGSSLQMDSGQVRKAPPARKRKRRGSWRFPRF